MALMRSMLLAASQNVWLREHAVHYPFVRRSVRRFMPGETAEEALAAAQVLRQKQIGSVFTHLGENVADRGEASKVTEHYVEVIRRIHELDMDSEVSVKLTQLGLDFSADFCAENLEKIIRAEKSGSDGVGGHGSEQLCRCDAGSLQARAIETSERGNLPAGLSLPDEARYCGTIARCDRRSGW